MTLEYFPTSLMDVPDELLLQIVEYLHVLRSHQTQSEAFKSKAQEVSRQRENHQRQKTLHALCLTSRRMKGISEPILYSAFLGSSTWRGRGPINYFYRTISKRPQLAQCVRYIENRLSDYLGNALYHDMEFCGAVKMVQDYFFKLASIVSHTCNIQHLSVVSPETKDVFFWRHLLDTGSSSLIASHGFPKLQSLCVQFQDGSSSHGYEIVWFQKIANALTNVPTFRSLRASGAVSDTVVPIVGRYESLDDIEISECILDFDVVVQLMSACKMLKHFSCQWAYLDCEFARASDLYYGLLPHKESLESLHMDLREVRYMYDLLTLESWGSLRGFNCLKSFTCGITFDYTLFILDFLGQHPTCRIAEMLPPSLESLTLLLQLESCPKTGFRVDESSALWELAEDCEILLPNLIELNIRCWHDVFGKHLEVEFGDIGVNLTFTRDAGCPTCR